VAPIESQGVPEAEGLLMTAGAGYAVAPGEPHIVEENPAEGGTCVGDPVAGGCVVGEEHGAKGRAAKVRRKVNVGVGVAVAPLGQSWVAELRGTIGRTIRRRAARQEEECCGRDDGAKHRDQRSVKVRTLNGCCTPPASTMVTARPPAAVAEVRPISCKSPYLSRPMISKSPAGRTK
jgi:hypothetical protein